MYHVRFQRFILDLIYTDQQPWQRCAGREKPQIPNEIFLIQLVMALK